MYIVDNLDNDDDDDGFSITRVLGRLQRYRLVDYSEYLLEKVFTSSLRQVPNGNKKFSKGYDFYFICLVQSPLY
jgi:hypothetical protein